MAEDLLEGKAAFEAIAAEIAALEGVPGRLPALDIEESMKMLGPLISPLVDGKAALASFYNVETGRELSEAIDRLAVMRRATTYASRHHQRLSGPKQGATLSELLKEGYALRRQAMRTLKILVLLGVVSEEEERNIRRGSGSADLAGDLDVVGRKGLDLWDEAVGPLQALQRVEAHRLTPEKLKRMDELSSLITDSVDDPSGEGWREKTIRCWALTERTWDLVRDLAAPAWRKLGHPDRAAALVSLYALR